LTGLDTTHVGLVVDELVAAADRLDLRWRLRPATVTTPAASGAAMAVLDGDTVPVKVIPLVGSVVVGDRVMVAIVPPSGHYAIGWVSSPPWATLDSLIISTNGTYYNATAEGLVTSASVTGTLVAGERVRVEARLPISCATSGHVGRFRIRVTNTAGAIVSRRQHTFDSAAGADTSLYGYYDVPSSGTYVFVLTAERAGGATSNVVVTVTSTVGQVVTMALTRHMGAGLARIV